MAGKTKRMAKSLGTRTGNDGALSSAHDEHSPSSAQAFAAKAKDLATLREAVVDAAGVGAGLWLSYLFLFFYLFIAVAAVTHRDLLFENPVKLPFLNVELPLLGFFVLGPLLFLILQAYVLLHFAMFAGKVGVFDAELRAQVKDDDTRARLRRQLPSNIFVQYLAGPNEVRTGVMGFMLRLIALISLVLFPIALLVFFQLQFLPYHNAPITWWHRIAVLLGILLLWVLWPSIARGQTTWISWRDFRRPQIMVLLLASLVPLLLVFTIATFPGEWLDSNLPSLPLVPTKSLEWTSLHGLLVAGDVDLVARKPTSLWSNRLVVPGVDVVDHAKFDSEEKIAALPETLSLRGRHLEGAVLIGSGLRKADFTAAQLQGAVLVLADLRAAVFGCELRKIVVAHKDCAQLQGAFLSLAQLQNASLRGAELQRANLEGAQLQGASLDDAHLEGANLEWAQLQRASLLRAKLQGADLMWADLGGADLRSANLQGAALIGAPLHGANLSGADLPDANLVAADLRGANFRWASLQGAALIGAQLQGASLKEAYLQGANLEGAHLQGASLEGAQLQGASLKRARLQGASLKGAQLYGADLTGAEVWLAPFPAGLETQSPVPLGVANLKMSPLTTQDKIDLAGQLQADIADDELQKALLDRLNPILQDKPETWEDEDNWSRYVEQAKEPPPDEIAQVLADMACGDELIATAMSARAIALSYDDSKRHYAKPLAKALLSETCRGAKALTDKRRAKLQELGSAPE
jgi:uncharacterized protein YjbI with pentapeptide repeats